MPTAMSAYGPGYQSRYTTGVQANPWQRFTNSLSAGNYQGSSGYWGGPAVPGQNPGDAGRADLAARAGLNPSAVGPFGTRTGVASGLGGPDNRLAQLKADYEAGKIPFEKLFEQYQLPSRYPEVSSATGNTFRDVAAADKGLGLPNFNDLKNQFSGATGDVGNWYNRYQAGNDITGFAQGQRAADAAAAALTGQYAGTARGILGQAEGITNRYRTEGQGALDKVLGNAEAFYNKDIPASIQDAQNRAVQYTSRYGAGAGGGLGSDIVQMAGRSAVQAALPFQREGRGFIDSALRQYQPFYGDVASRDYNRVAGLNLPTEQNIYGAQVGDVLRGKGTEQQIQNLDMLVRERGLQAAVENLKRQGLPETLINDMVAQWQRLKSGNLALTGQAAGLEQQYGAERGYNYLPGSGPVTQPQYYGLPNASFPNGVPNRYSPGGGAGVGGGATTTGTQTGGGGFSGAPQGPQLSPYMPDGSMNPAYTRSLSQWIQDQRAGYGIGDARYTNTGRYQESVSGIPGENWWDYLPAEGG